MKMWVKTPFAGGSNIPDAIATRTRKEIRESGAKLLKGKRLDFRFKNQFCYVGVYLDGKTPLPLCRLRYFKYKDEWGLALFNASNEKYEAALFESGAGWGTATEGFVLAASFLNE